jgi:hypothetical protein
VVYPNPFTNQLTVETGTTDEVTMRLYNYTGQLVYAAHNNEPQVTIELGMLPDGFYLLKLVYSQGAQETVRVVKR